MASWSGGVKTNITPGASPCCPREFVTFHFNLLELSRTVQTSSFCIEICKNSKFPLNSQFKIKTKTKTRALIGRFGIYAGRKSKQNNSLPDDSHSISSIKGEFQKSLIKENSHKVSIMVIPIEEQKSIFFLRSNDQLEIIPQGRL